MSLNTLLLLLTATANALPISPISATAEFSPVGGSYDEGVLVLASTMPLLVYYQDGSQHELAYAKFFMRVGAAAGHSTSGLAHASFQGGTLRLEDSDNLLLLDGTMDHLVLYEDQDDTGFLTGMAMFRVTGGELAGDLSAASISRYEIAFKLCATALQNPYDSFSGDVTISRDPVPVPATIGLLSLGLAGLFIRRRKS